MSRCHKSLDLLRKVCTNSRYLIWWQLADEYHWTISNCEIMVEILCQASLHKIDDVRLKSLPMSSASCTLCDLGCIDDAFHLVIQCPKLQDKRNVMFSEIDNICNGDIGLLNAEDGVFWMLMGRPWKISQ